VVNWFRLYATEQSMYNVLVPNRIQIQLFGKTLEDIRPVRPVVNDGSCFSKRISTTYLDDKSKTSGEFEMFAIEA
ncbi:unnamed protein product, partial [Allacma fusca]